MSDSDVNREISLNQAIAFNLRRGRVQRNLTQDRAAELIQKYSGVRWSRASFSQAERSIDGPPVRQFDANEIMAFCLAFELPLSYFFEPPPGTTFLYASEQRPSEAAWGHGSIEDVTNAPFIPEPQRPEVIKEIIGLGSGVGRQEKFAQLHRLVNDLERGS